jgi:hypothetical protein
LKRLGRDGGKEIDQVAVGVAQQQRAVAPGHGGGRLHHGVGQQGRQAVVGGIYVGHPKLDDGRAVGRRGGYVGSAKGLQRARAADGQRSGGRAQLGKIGGVLRGGQARRQLVELDEGLNIGGNEADGKQVHGDGRGR